MTTNTGRFVSPKFGMPPIGTQFVNCTYTVAAADDDKTVGLSFDGGSLTVKEMLIVDGDMNIVAMYKGKEYVMYHANQYINVLSTLLN